MKCALVAIFIPRWKRNIFPGIDEPPECIYAQRIAMANPNRHLIELNRELLRQALELLAAIDDHLYTQPMPHLMSSSIGAQFRHVLEFYECFLHGLSNRHIDYNARRRDRSVESSRTVAMERLAEAREKLAAVNAYSEATVWVRMEDAQPGDGHLTSSIARELNALTSHTIHHYAVIAVALRAIGRTVDRQFGVAPSTLRFWASREAA